MHRQRELYKPRFHARNYELETQQRHQLDISNVTQKGLNEGCNGIELGEPLDLTKTKPSAEDFANNRGHFGNRYADIFMRNYQRVPEGHPINITRRPTKEVSEVSSRCLINCFF